MWHAWVDWHIILVQNAEGRERESVQTAFFNQKRHISNSFTNQNLTLLYRYKPGY